jgi:hypothetical protein
VGLLGTINVDVFNHPMFAMLMRGNKNRAGGGATVAAIGASIFLGSGSQSISGASATISFDTLGFDTSGFLVGGTLPATTLTIPAGFGGVYWVNGSLTWSNITAGSRSIQFLHNGTPVNQNSFSLNGSVAGQWNVQGGCLINFAAGDTIALSALQSSGSAQSVLASASVLETFLQIFGFH